MPDFGEIAMIRVYTAAGPADAQLVCGHLLGNGVKAVVQGESLWGARGGVPVGDVSAPTVWVEESDATRARVLIDEIQQHEPSRLPPWDCPDCGEKLAGQFSACWKCGAPREDGGEQEGDA
jgi:hypothetical protein